MKKSICLILLMISFSAIAQVNDIIAYKAKSMDVVMLDDNNEIKLRKVFGKNVTIVYDKIFKSYKIQFEDENGRYDTLQFTYVAGYSDSKGNNYTMQESGSSGKGFVKLLDQIIYDGNLVIGMYDRVDGYQAYFYISNAEVN